MASCKSDTEGGYNAFIEGQKKVEGEALVTLAQFDSHGYDIIYEAKPVAKVPPLVLNPRGNTPLYDSIARTINEQGMRFDKATTKPDKVILVIITDGQENASREYTRENVYALIQRQEKEWNWSVTYIGANQDAIAVGQSIGVSAAQSLTSATDPKSARLTYAALNASVSRGRVGMDMAYTPDERKGAISGLVGSSK
jgi:hypothetical protein